MQFLQLVKLLYNLQFRKKKRSIVVAKYLLPSGIVIETYGSTSRSTKTVLRGNSIYSNYIYIR
jgi:hypothetical protein